jgi:hypothetical protein
MSDPQHPFIKKLEIKRTGFEEKQWQTKIGQETH